MSTAEAAGTLCWIVGVILWLVSAILAVVALGLSPFTDTAFIARRFSRDALCLSIIAILTTAAVTVTNGTHRHVNADGLTECGTRVNPWTVVVLIGTVPLVAIGAGFWSRRTERQK